MTREEAIDALRNLYDRCMWASQCENIGCVKCEEALNMAIEALQKDICKRDAFIQVIDEILTALPSADRPSGEWSIEERESIYGTKYILTCSVCGDSVSVTENSLPHEKYCRNCGAKMGAKND